MIQSNAGRAHSRMPGNNIENLMRAVKSYISVFEADYGEVASERWTEAYESHRRVSDMEASNPRVDILILALSEYEAFLNTITESVRQSF